MRKAFAPLIAAAALVVAGVAMPAGPAEAATRYRYSCTYQGETKVVTLKRALTSEEFAQIANYGATCTALP